MAVTEQSATAASFGADDGLLKLVTENIDPVRRSILFDKAEEMPRLASPPLTRPG